MSSASHINSFHFTNNIIFSFYSEENRGTERVSNMPSVTQQEIGKVQIQISILCSAALVSPLK